MTQEPYKICSECQQAAALNAPSCLRCGHQYRTRFTNPNQTQAVMPPGQSAAPPPYSPSPPYGAPQPGPYATPQQPAHGQPPPYAQAPYGYGAPYGQPYSSQWAGQYAERKSKFAAAALAFFFGGWGIHGFYLGNNKMGMTLLLIYLISLPLVLVVIGILGLLAVGGICLVQTILYLCATDDDFHQKYVVEKRWF